WARAPRRSEVRLRSGSVVEFDYPSQFPPVLVMFGDLIDPEFAFLREVAEQDWTVADVGAAIGQFSLFAASLPGALVHAFEPSSRNVATLERNLARNGLAGRVVVHRLALSSADGEASFETTPQTWMSRLSPAPGPGTEAVPVRRLSGIMDELAIGRLSVLKINVAGF